MIFGVFVIFFFKQKTAYEMRMSDWSSDVCSSDLQAHACVVSGSRRRSGGICDQIKHIGNSLSKYSKSKTGGPAPISAESANGYGCCRCRPSGCPHGPCPD